MHFNENEFVFSLSFGYLSFVRLSRAVSYAFQRDEHCENMDVFKRSNWMLLRSLIDFVLLLLHILVRGWSMDIWT